MNSNNNKNTIVALYEQKKVFKNNKTGSYHWINDRKTDNS